MITPKKNFNNKARGGILPRQKPFDVLMKHQTLVKIIQHQSSAPRLVARVQCH